MSVEHSVTVDFESGTDGEIVVATERRKFDVDDLFNDDELRLWQDNCGWNGYVREFVDGEVRYYAVNTRFDDETWLSKIRCSESAVREAVRKHIEDEKAGGAGKFRRRCSPP